MPRSEDAVSPLREVLAGLRTETDAVIGRFYQRLLARRPEFAPHFAETGWAHERRMLLHALVLALETAEEPDETERTLRGFGRRHRPFALNGEDYAVFGEVLRETLRDHVGAAWSAEIDASWCATYADVVRRMAG